MLVVAKLRCGKDVWGDDQRIENGRRAGVLRKLRRGNGTRRPGLRRLRPAGGGHDVKYDGRSPARLHSLLPELRHRRAVGRRPHLPPLRSDAAVSTALPARRRPLPRLRRGNNVGRGRRHCGLRRRVALPGLRRRSSPRCRFLPQLRASCNRRSP